MSRWRREHRADVARRLHADARFALIISLLSFAFPLALPAGLFLAWRVRDRARRAMPGLVEWVSLPFYVASFCLWLGVAVSMFGISLVTLTWHR